MLAALAREHLDLTTLESNGHHTLDGRHIRLDEAKVLLIAAYEAGRRAGRKAARRDAEDWRGYVVNLIGAGE